jgi:hypothetical protein
MKWSLIARDVLMHKAMIAKSEMQCCALEMAVAGLPSLLNCDPKK